MHAHYDEEKIHPKEKRDGAPYQMVLGGAATRH
jgi:hypothetical protein